MVIQIIQQNPRRMQILNCLSTTCQKIKNCLKGGQQMSQLGDPQLNNSPYEQQNTKQILQEFSQHNTNNVNQPKDRITLKDKQKTQKAQKNTKPGGKNQQKYYLTEQPLNISGANWKYEDFENFEEQTKDPQIIKIAQKSYKKEQPQKMLSENSKTQQNLYIDIEQQVPRSEQQPVFEFSEHQMKEESESQESEQIQEEDEDGMDKKSDEDQGSEDVQNNINNKHQLDEHVDVEASRQQQPQVDKQLAPKPQIKKKYSSPSSSSEEDKQQHEQSRQKPNSIQVEEKQNEKPAYAHADSYPKQPTKLVEQPLLSKIRKIEEGTAENIEDSQPFPYSMVGCLEMRLSIENAYTKAKKNRTFVGSGVVIGPKYVLTACHNLYNSKQQQEYQLNCFRLQYKNFNDQPQFEKNVKIKSKFGNIEQFQKAIKNGDFSLDYAFLQLDTDEDLEEFNNFRFDFGDKEENSEADKVIISYPLSSESKAQFSESKGRTIVQENHIYHQFKVSQGSSGGPIFRLEEGDYVIVGLHTGNAHHKVQETSQNFECRVGPKFTERIFSEFVRFMAKIDGCVDLKNKQIGNEGCRVLVEALGEELTHLNLTNNKVGLKACESLAECRWVNLRVLNLSNNLLNAQCFAKLKQVSLPSLFELVLRQNQLSGECCEQLIEIALPTLQALNLGYNNFGDDGCKAISRSSWPKLKKLYLFWSNIEAEGCLHLSQANWPQLTFIDLHENGINGSGCQHFTKASWPNLEEIILDKNIIGDEGCEQLAKTPWHKLERVHLWRNSITVKGAAQLLKAEWGKLAFMNLSQNSIENPQNSEKQFLKKYPKLEISLE